MSKETEISQQDSSVTTNKPVESPTRSPIIKSYSREINPFHETKLTMNQILKEDRTAIRQDYVIYRFNFASVCQAAAIVLGVVMSINAILYLNFRFNITARPNWEFLFSWIMFGESGILLLFSGLSIPRLRVTKKQRNMNKNQDPRRNSLLFAFIHSLTYFIAGICLMVLSLFASNVFL